MIASLEVEAFMLGCDSHGRIKVAATLLFVLTYTRILKRLTIDRAASILPVWQTFTVLGLYSNGITVLYRSV